MENIAEGIVAGFAISTAIPAMYYFNKAALGTLFGVNRAIGKALLRFLLPPEMMTRNTLATTTTVKSSATSAAAASINAAVIINHGKQELNP